MLAVERPDLRRVCPASMQQEEPERVSDMNFSGQRPRLGLRRGLGTDNHPAAALGSADNPTPPMLEPLENPPSLIETLRIMRDSPLTGLLKIHFEQSIVISKAVIGTIAVVSDPTAIRHVLVDNADNYCRDRIQQQMMELPYGNSLLAAKGQQWRRQRHSIAPAFTPRIVEDYARGMAIAACDLVTRWANCADGSRVDVARELDRAMVDMLGRTLFSDGFGADLENMVRKAAHHFELVASISVLDLLNMPAWLPRLNRVRLRRVLAYFEKLAGELIETRQRRLAASALAPPNDLMTVLLQANEKDLGCLSRQEVVANLFTFFAAGYETSAIALSWALYLLSTNSEWRERIEMEADHELAGDWYLENSLERLVVTRAVIEEALRLFPPIPTINRQAIAADRLGQQSIEPGTIVIIAPWVLHRHRLLWDAPNTFDPSRFLPPAREKIDRFAYLPFGAGPRTCIGAYYAMQAMIIMLASIVRAFRLTVAPDHQVWPVHRVSLHPKGGLPMILHRRGN
jgi:cytochrome P450